MTDPADASARRDALDTGHSFHVESPAGSGKTLLLTTRFVKLLAQVDHPAEILALTFTEKAAREMRNRITDALQKALDPELRRSSTPTSPAEEELIGAAEDAVHRHSDRLQRAASSSSLNIMTFHGFCHYLASRAPLEAGINPDFTIADDAAQPLLAAESVTRSLNRLFRLPLGDTQRRALENRALYHDNNQRALTDELIDIIRKRDRFADLVAVISRSGGSDLSRFRKTLETRVRFYVESRLKELAGHCLRAPLGRDWRRLMAHLSEEGAEAADWLPAEMPGANWEDLPAWKRVANCLLTRTGTPLKTLGPKRGFYSGFVKSDLAALIRDMPPSLSRLLHDTREYPGHDEPSVDMETLTDFIILCAAIINDYELFCKKRSQTDFIGLEYCALRVLDTTDPSDLSLFLDHRLRHILIDEFQDTNRLQWELLRRLVDGWDGEDGRTVFIVGDPKQSIYGFRNAEVNLFYEAKQGIPRSGSGPLALSSRLLQTNFRSAAGLVEWVNRIFGTTIMTDPNEEVDEVPFSPSTAGNSVIEDEPSPVSLALFAGPDSASARADEAAWLAATAKQLVTETSGHSSLGVLLFTRTHLRTYLRAFSDCGVPLQVQEGLHLADRPETGHLVQAARALARPHDDCAWASLLRSPWSWFDVSLLAETALSPEAPWIDKLRALEGKRPKMKELLGALDSALRRIGRDPLGRVVRTLWEDLDGARQTASLYGMAGVANCIRLCTILDDMDEGSPQETLERFESLLETFYEPVDPTTAWSPVHMMTIHRAKGLEFDMVLLPFMDWNPLAVGSAGPPPYLVERLPGKKEEHLIATGRDRRKPDPDPLFRILSRLEKERTTGEAKRLFYVAATRARSRLIMSGITGLKDGNPAEPRKSPLDWVWTHHGGRDRLMPEWPGKATVTDAGIGFEINPAPPEGSAEPPSVDIPTTDQLPAALDIQPQRRTLSVKTPSSGDRDPGPDEGMTLAVPEKSERSVAAIRGMFIHRLLKRGLEEKALPLESAIAQALLREGMAREESRRLASAILEETRATLDSPFIANLLRKAVGPARTEWSLESALSETSLLSGSIDLALFDGTCWWIIDFKTGAHGVNQDRNLFLTTEEKRYHNQIAAYRTLLKDFIAPDLSPVRAGIFFTALGEWREILFSD